WTRRSTQRPRRSQREPKGQSAAGCAELERTYPTGGHAQRVSSARTLIEATVGRVAAMIVRQGGIVALAGVTAGLAAAGAGSRLIESLLYGISPRDPGVFAATTLL